MIDTLKAYRNILTAIRNQTKDERTERQLNELLTITQKMIEAEVERHGKKNN